MNTFKDLTVDEIGAEPDEQAYSFLKRLLVKTWQLRMGVYGGSFLVIIFMVALLSPLIAPHDPFEQDIMNRLKPPCWLEGGTKDHILGTDHVGRDLLSRIIYGSRISLIIGVFAMVLSAVIGTILGLLAGFYGGKIDSVISFAVNCMMSFPFILLAMSLVLVLGASLKNIIIAIGVTSWPVFTRVIRVETRRLRDQEFILAAITMGFSTARILIHQIMPNLIPSLTVISTIAVAQAIIREALLSFLGLGIQPPTPSWGVMLAEGRGYLLNEWWITTFPGLAIFFTAVGINLLGDAIRDITDPNLRKS